MEPRYSGDTVFGGPVFGRHSIRGPQYSGGRYSGDTVFGGHSIRGPVLWVLPRINIFERDQLDKPKLRVLFNLFKCENTDFKAIYIHYTYNISEY